MSWINPANAQPTGYNPKARVSGFIQKFGQLGEVALGAWNAVDPLRCCHCPDEYLGYARRFVEGVVRVIPSEWPNHPDLVEELVRRSFYPTQVVNHTGLGHPWVTAEDIKSIAQHIAGRVEQLGGMEDLLPES
ncbi:MAG: hypothetical protein COV29_01565 [Candidatus Yanofskybacteria bacterium CG10_big_fil_rev_8_21_14_0_10_36_16]|uniref:Uncharacterized protein n=1 Tax=Candidatus Yanofskybacteria bacterium CG10_big_fil_rev_8_21_14_0_10_36_16 TaxID=1975096 RepID=A0A2J0Q796_9BACT|nr:MAG: hypothetical protein COV29_01565 [Candidatus Yanofskybacteria bacterium CG10_big_fil_rev_8_21_14_0_10_36_16]